MSVGGPCFAPVLPLFCPCFAPVLPQIVQVQTKEVVDLVKYVLCCLCLYFLRWWVTNEYGGTLFCNFFL